ncbi:hypothetical protein Tco_0177071, partial [Tanacetum coccineum]
LQNHPPIIHYFPSGTPPLLPIPLPAPSTSRKADIPEADTPPWKRLLLTAPRPGCEVGESSAAAAARQPGPTMAQKDRAAVRAEKEDADDRAMRHIMRIHALEAGARDDTLEDTASKRYIGMDWLAKYQAVIVYAEKIVRIAWGNETLIIHGDG